MSTSNDPFVTGPPETAGGAAPPGMPANSAETSTRSWSKPLAFGLIGLVMACLLLFGTFSLGVLVGRESDGSAGAKIDDEQIEVVQQAWDVVEEHYVQEQAIDEDAMLEGAIDGMLATLGDQGHTRYLTPEEDRAEQQSSSGVYVGIGVQVSMRDEGLTIVRVFSGSPAEDAGVLPGDVVVAVDDEDVTDLSQEEIINRIRGPEGTDVSVTFQRPPDNAQVTFDMERSEIEVSAVSWTMLEGQVALLKLDQFQARAADDLAAALQEAQDQGATGIILDLRYNPGGFVDEATRIASMFLPDDTPIFIRETRDGGQETVETEETDVNIEDDLPLVVLVNNGTASASEIVSGAIQASGRGVIMGTQTIGTGTVLRKFTLEDGSAIWLGVELWLTPAGDMIRDVGITPDIVVELPEDQFPYQPTSLDPVPVPTSMLDDDQLTQALDLITSGELESTSVRVPAAGAAGS